MNETDFAALTIWIAQAGLAGSSEQEIVAGVCDRLRAGGVALARANVVIDTLHPTREGRVFRWRRGEQAVAAVEYGRGGVADESWTRSPFHHLVTTGARSLRRRLAAETEGEFGVFSELRSAGQTEYLAIVDRLGTAERIGEIDCVYSSWTTDAPGGFQDHEVRAIEGVSPFLALAVKAACLAEVARTLVETYLGRDAGRRVLTGRIVRGLADRIQAVLWYSDLRDYTRISDMAAPEQIIPLLNDYADLVVTAVHRQGGDVLKFVGDGVLALFTQDARPAACAAAVAAAQAARAGIAGLNARRHAEGLPTTDFRLGLHLGPVFYGNIGSPDRLDFTVVGPAVNEVSRIAAMCRAVDQPVLMSSAFATTLDPERRRFASIGRYALRGVARAQELFTLDPEREPAASPQDPTPAAAC